MPLADQIASLNNAFGKGGWRRIGESPEAREDDPQGAWVEVEAGECRLRLRLVRDRGRDHIDVKCADGRWVPLEIVAVALDEKCLTDYLAAFNATLNAAQDEPMPDDAEMWQGTIDFVAKHADKLAKQTANADGVRAAERCIATETQHILEQHSV